MPMLIPNHTISLIRNLRDSLLPTTWAIFFKHWWPRTSMIWHNQPILLYVLPPREWCAILGACLPSHPPHNAYAFVTWLSHSVCPALLLCATRIETWFHSPRCSLNGSSPITLFSGHKCDLHLLNSTVSFAFFPVRGGTNLTPPRYLVICVLICPWSSARLSNQKARSAFHSLAYSMVNESELGWTRSRSLWVAHSQAGRYCTEDQGANSFIKSTSEFLIYLWKHTSRVVFGIRLPVSASLGHVTHSKKLNAI